jgi:ABC-type amino acid transport substrate-binding protein
MKKMLAAAALAVWAIGSGQALADAVVKKADDAQAGMDSDKLRIGMVVGATPPRSYYPNADPTQKLTGYEPDILEEIARRIGKEIVYYDVAWAGLFTGLLAEKWDVGASNVFIKIDREAMMDFSEPHLDSDIGVLASVKSDMKTLADLKGKTLGADTGSGAEVWLRENIDKWGPYTIQTYNGVPDAFLDVLTGRLDGAITDASNVDWYVKDHSDRVKRAMVLGEAYRVGFAFRPDSPLKDEFTRAIREMKKEGVIAEIYKKYYGVLPPEGNSAMVLYDAPSVPTK